VRQERIKYQDGVIPSVKAVEMTVLGPVAFAVLVLLAALVAVVSVLQPGGVGTCVAGIAWDYASIETGDGDQIGKPIMLGLSEFKGASMCHASRTVNVDGSILTYDFYFSDQPPDVWAVIADKEYHLTNATSV
jgi:hypothetical protein